MTDGRDVPTACSPAAGPRASVFETASLLGVVLLVLLAAIPCGAMSLWSQGALFAGVAGLVGLWALRALWHGELVFVRTPLWWAVAALLGIVVLQCISLPAPLVAVLSPEAAIARQPTAAPAESAAPTTLSLLPHGTRAALGRALLVAGVFFVIVQTLRRRWQLVGLAVAVPASALLQCAVGAVDLASAAPAGAAPGAPVGGEALAGTFLESAHLAGLLVMALGVTSGLFLASLAASPRTGGAPARGERRRRAWRRALLATGLILAAAIGWTRVHSGLLAALVAAFGVLACLGFAARLRRSTRALLVAVALGLLGGQFIALEVVTAWLERGAPAVGLPWAVRADLYRAALALVGVFAATGSGLGTFGDVFPRFQSSALGDAVVDRLPSDWLQLAGEIGLPAAALVLLAGGGLIVATLGRALRRTDPLCRWLAVGSAVGAAAVAVQAAVDGPLARVPANGLVLAVLAGLAFVAARAAGTDTGGSSRFVVGRIRLGPPALRALGAAGCVALLAAAVQAPARRALAEIAFQRHRAACGEPVDRCFFLPVAAGIDPIAADRWLDRAVALDPERPGYLRAAAQRLLARAETSPTEPAALEQALGLLDRAVALAPARADYRLERGRVRLRLVGAEPGDERASRWRAAAARDTSHAMGLAPNRPGVLYRAGALLLELAARADDRPAREQCLAAASGGFRRALAARPDYAEPVYDLLLASERDPRALFAATPETLPGYAGLVNRLVAEEAWSEGLSALEGLERLGEVAAPGSGAVAAAARRVVGPGDAALEARIEAVRQRAVILGRLGCSGARTEAVRRLEMLLAESLEPAVAAAEEKAAAGRHAAAIATLRGVLARDRNHPRALLALARLAHEVEAGEERHLCPPPLEPLLRLVRVRRDAPSELFARAAETAAALRPASAAEAEIGRFVEAVAWLRAGRPALAAERLSALAQPLSPAASEALGAHVLLERLGRARAACGDREEARAALLTALALVPEHQPARAALAELDGTPLAAADPGMRGLVPVDVGFADRVRLVGLRLEPAAGSAGEESVRLITRWECGEEPLEGGSLRASSPGGGSLPVVVPLADGGRCVPAGARVTRVLVLAAGAAGIELAVVVDRPAAGEERTLRTDAGERALHVGAPRID
ncbi:MAG: hypothetical protein JXQ29_03125, partial [Planctomycetes bacterium]|nr:hypothetical protein [Planctomycetota bacterium]